MLFRSKYALPSMVERRWGRIINFTGGGAASDRPLRGGAAYGSSKAGVEGLTRNMAVEVGRFGITCNAIAPGRVDTLGFPAATIVNSSGTLVGPEHAARLAVWLASDASAEVNAAAIDQTAKLLAAAIKGFGSATLLASYERERRPVGYRNRQASERHTGVRIAIAELYRSERDLDALARGIAALGNAENESWGVEFGYRYDGVESDPLVYRPTTAPGARLPSVVLKDGTFLYDRLGPWFTLLCFGGADPSSLIDAADRKSTRLNSSHRT